MACSNGVTASARGVAWLRSGFRLELLSGWYVLLWSLWFLNCNPSVPIVKELRLSASLRADLLPQTVSPDMLTIQPADTESLHTQPYTVSLMPHSS